MSEDEREIDIESEDEDGNSRYVTFDNLLVH